MKPVRPLRLNFSIPSPSPTMSRSNASFHPISQTDDDDDDYGDEEEEGVLALSQASLTMPSSPAALRRLHSARTSELNLRSRLPSQLTTDERSGLLAFSDGRAKTYMSAPNTARPRISRRPSVSSIRMPKHHSRASSWGVRLASALGSSGLADSKASLFVDERVWYDQFTSTDWVHDSIADAFRIRDLRSRKDIRGRLYAWFDGAQGWILVAMIGCITACIAYFVTVTETKIFDLKEGYCRNGWYFDKRKCCYGEEECPAWKTWGVAMKSIGMEEKWIDFIAYVFFVVLLSVMACFLTLLTRTEIPSTFSMTTLDENLGADTKRKENGEAYGTKGSLSPMEAPREPAKPSTTVYYPAAGSGVAEVKVILSGFVVHGYLGVKTLVVKTVALIFSVSSGLSLGKEGPYVHIATCVGNIACRVFSKYNHNDGKRREMLSAAAACGVGVAFGAPIGGVLFSLEEVSYYFPAKTLFRTFFCCIAAALSVKFLDPYGTGKIVIFEVRYVTDWKSFEIFAFILLGVLGGALGALFIKASGIWARTFRRIPTIKKWPVLEVALVALITGLTSYWNRYTKLAVTELLFEIAAPCRLSDKSGLCPQDGNEIMVIVRYLCVAFVVKAFLTIITFGIKLPAGIYVPSMVVGGLLGRIVGHLVQYLTFRFPDAAIFASCPADGGLESCVTPGVYALVAAGATMCGVTRLSVTLAVILFELTGSLDHVLPFSLSVLVAKWTADAIEPLSIYVSSMR
jgi:chloride channel 3/4/5